MELIAISIVIIHSFDTKPAFDCLRFGKFWPHICESCGATCRLSYESFSALQSTSIPLNRCWKLRPNWSITGDAILPQNAAKLTKKTQFWIWHSAVAPSNTTEKIRNMGAQLVPQLYNCHIFILENLLFVWLLVRINLFVLSHFWTTCMKFDTCCWRYVARCDSFLCGCTSTFSALNHCDGILLQYFCYPYEVVRTKFSADFSDFSQFLIAFLQKLWRQLATKMRTI